MGAALMAAPYILNGLGAVFGKKRKYVDPQYLHDKYGPDAIAADTQRIANNILNSPYGQQLLAHAATSGQQLQSNLASNAAASGMGNGSGATSGASDFAAATAPQAQAALEGQTKAGIWQSAMPLAAGLNQNLMGVAERGAQYDNNQPSTFEKIAGAAGQWASTLSPTQAAVTATPQALTQNPDGTTAPPTSMKFYRKAGEEAIR